MLLSQKDANLTTMANGESIDAVLDYWFGPLDEQGLATPAQQQLWFKSSSATDDDIRARFMDLIDAALMGELMAWRETPAGCVALVLLLDQFTRNVFRATPRAFAGDPLALKIARRLVSNGQHLDLPLSQRVFIYMPYEHAEQLELQDECLALFDQLLAQCPLSARDQFARFRQYAAAHREVIARFGRFPHRNAILQRQSSAAELQHLEHHGGF